MLHPELQTDLSALVRACGRPAHALAKRIVATLTPDTAPEALAALLVLWQNACADPRHDWRWSEAGVAQVFAAFQTVAAPLLQPWLMPATYVTADIPLVGLAIMALRANKKVFDKALNDAIFCCPYRLYGRYGAATPDPARAEATQDFGALAHWALAEDPNLAHACSECLRRQTLQGQLTLASAVSWLASACRHSPFITPYSSAAKRCNVLLWALLAYAPSVETASALVLAALHDPHPNLRITVADLLATHWEVFDPALIEPLLEDEEHTVRYRVLAYFEAAGNSEVVKRALGKGRARLYAAQVVCHWATAAPQHLADKMSWDMALREALAAHYAKWPDDWSELSWILKALLPVGCSSETLRIVLPFLRYNEASTRSRASEVASAVAVRLPLAERTAANLAIQDYYTIECADCKHKFHGWAGPYRTGVVLHCPHCKRPMLEHRLGWYWLGRNGELNRYKRLPSLMPYDAE